MRTLLLFSTILLFAFTTSTHAQVELKMRSPKKMKKDLKVLLETMEGHPDPYTKISEGDFQKLVDSVSQNISVELDEIDFYKNMACLVSSIRDGHSGVYFKSKWMENIRKKNGVFPYEVFLSNDEELYIVSSYGDDQIPLGSQIVEINGMSISDFIEEASPYISYELIPFRNDQLSRSFELLLYLVFKQVDQLEFKIRRVKEETIVLNTMDFKEWKKQKKELRKERDKKIQKGKPYDYKIIKPGIAKIDIFSFSVRDLKNYKIFLDKTFKDIRKQEVHSLIIDVRGNYGGWPKVSSELFHFIHEGYFKTMAQSRAKISSAYRRSFTDAHPNLRNTNNIIFRQLRHAIDLEKILNGTLNTYIDEDVFFNESPKTEKYEFYGDCYLLIDRKSFSAASSFASTFQCYNMGLIIGEPTGGTKIFRANAFSKKLPKSKLLVRMSSTKLSTTCFNKEDEPIQPNIEVSPTIIDRVHKVDSQLNWTLRLIRKIQKKKAEEGK